MFTHFTNILQKKFNVDAAYFIKGGFWTTLGQAVGISGGLAVTVLLANLLTENEYGTYRYLIGLAALLASFSLTGMGQAVLQSVAKGYQDFYRTHITTTLLFSSGVFLLAGGVAAYYYLQGNTILALGCFLIACIQPIISTFQYTPQHLQGNQQFKTTTYLHTIRTILITAASITAALLTQNIVALFATYLISHAIIHIATYHYFVPKVPKHTAAPTARKYLSFAKKTSLRNVFIMGATRLDTFIIFTYLGAPELAIYTITSVIPDQIKGSLKNITSLLVPKYAKHDSLTSIKAGLPKRSLQLGALLLGIGAIYALLATPLYTLLFPTYENAALYSILLALSFPSFILYLPYTALQTQLADRELNRIVFINAILNTIIMGASIVLFGLLGAILAKIINRYTITALSYYYLYTHSS